VFLLFVELSIAPAYRFRWDAEDPNFPAAILRAPAWPLIRSLAVQAGRGNPFRDLRFPLPAGRRESVGAPKPLSCLNAAPDCSKLPEPRDKHELRRRPRARTAILISRRIYEFPSAFPRSANTSPASSPNRPPPASPDAAPVKGCGRSLKCSAWCRVL